MLCELLYNSDSFRVISLSSQLPIHSRYASHQSLPLTIMQICHTGVNNNLGAVYEHLISSQNKGREGFPVLTNSDAMQEAARSGIIFNTQSVIK